MITLNCKTCKKDFEVKPYRKDIAKYCNPVCAGLDKEHRENISKSKKGKSCTNPDFAFKKGHQLIGDGIKGFWERGGQTWNRGKKLSIEHIAKLKKSHLGQEAWNKGTHGKMNVLSGEKSHFWKGGITPINTAIRMSVEYKVWRDSVFKRDNYTCVFCGETGELNADHIKSFSKFPELRFSTENGRTLCVPCHKMTDNFGGRANRKISTDIKWDLLAVVNNI